MKYKINWWGVAFFCISFVFYEAGREDGKAAQIRESMPTEEQIEQYNKEYLEEMIVMCKRVWEEDK